MSAMQPAKEAIKNPAVESQQVAKRQKIQGPAVDAYGRLSVQVRFQDCSTAAFSYQASSKLWVLQKACAKRMGVELYLIRLLDNEALCLNSNKTFRQLLDLGHDLETMYAVHQQVEC